MNDIPMIRGMRNFDFHATGRIVTEMHEDHELKEDGFKRISLTRSVDGKIITNYFHFDMVNLQQAAEQAMELWLTIRQAHKDNPRQSLLMKAEK